MSAQSSAALLVAEFELFSDWEDKYAYIIDLGKHLRPYPEEKRTDSFLVRGCQSRVWLSPRTSGSTMHFDADSDAIIVKGLIAMLLRVYDGQSPQDILATPPEFLGQIGLDTHLSQSRANGLSNMVTQIMRFAASVASAHGGTPS